MLLRPYRAPVNLNMGKKMTYGLGSVVTLNSRHRSIVTSGIYISYQTQVNVWPQKSNCLLLPNNSGTILYKFL